mmetsp:Transcript_13012/g.28157  ORF Transcript_13012/g.28157 Transcript_13012/m.28157 type:complete len:439 (-) Transcript_13012:2869-4185(-)
MSGEEEQMDVDNVAAGESSGATGQVVQEKTLKVHPLALIAITDHHTRVVTGGSALPPGAPVVGLLFGHQDGLTVSVLDAAEMEHTFASSSSATDPSVDFGGGTEEEQARHKAGLETKISLHRKVFPTHEVVGWYRVGSDADGGGPTEQDLRTNNGKMRNLNESPLFLLMSAGRSVSGGDQTKADDANDGDKKIAGVASSAGQAARDKLDRDEQLPVSIYESLVTVDQAAVFVNLEFELETFEPERIAVENVFKAQRQAVAAAAAAEDDGTKMQTEDTSAATTSAAAGGGVLAKIKGVAAGAGFDTAADATDAPPSTAAMPPPPSELDAHFHTMKSSIESMNDRVAVLIDYLRRTQSGEIQPDYALLRQVDGLVRRLPLLMTSQSNGLPREFESEFDNAVLLSYLAAVTKTARAVRVVTDKSMLVLESASSEKSLRRVL